MLEPDSLRGGMARRCDVTDAWDLVSLDPGARACGGAAFRGGKLVSAGFVKADPPAKVVGAASARAGGAALMAGAFVRWVDGRQVRDVAVEWPRVYAGAIRRGESKADPNDLLALAASSAAVATALSRECGVEVVASYCPSEWKGQLPKDVCDRRVRSRLDAGEAAVLDLACVRAGKLAHNVVDAVGIGLHHLGRLAPRLAPRLAAGGAGQPGDAAKAEAAARSIWDD